MDNKVVRRGWGLNNAKPPARLTLLLTIGPEKAAAHANKPGDNTHINETDARAMAELVLKELPGADKRLGKLLKGQ